MRKTKTLTASLFLGFALTATAAAQGGAVRDIAAKTTISVSALKIEGDGKNQNEYSHSPSASVRSVVQTHGDWILDLSGSKKFQATRKVRIDFTDPVLNSLPNGGTPTGPSGAQFVLEPARFIASCHRSGYDVNMLEMAPGSEELCPLNITFDYLGSRYGITMNSSLHDEFGGFEDVDSVKIKCISETPECNSWTISPFVNGLSRGKLTKAPSKVNQPNEDLGEFYFSFDIAVSIP